MFRLQEHTNGSGWRKWQGGLESNKVRSEEKNGGQRKSGKIDFSLRAVLGR